MKRLENENRNLITLVRRLARNHPNEKLVKQATEYLQRIGQEGSILKKSSGLQTAMGQMLKKAAFIDNLRDAHPNLTNEDVEYEWHRQTILGNGAGR